MTIDEARGIALALPGAFESSHHGHPDFRIANGIFATLWPDTERSVLRLPMELAEELSSRYSIVGRSGGMGWIGIDLATANEAEFRDLIEIAWQVRGGASETVPGG